MYVMYDWLEQLLIFMNSGLSETRRQFRRQGRYAYHDTYKYKPFTFQELSKCVGATLCYGAHKVDISLRYQQVGRWKHSGE